MTFDTPIIVLDRSPNSARRINFFNSKIYRNEEVALTNEPSYIRSCETPALTATTETTTINTCELEDQLASSDNCEKSTTTSNHSLSCK
jgi:hypothetical protein